MSVRWRAPGRVNLIGEHTDYNAGLALPFATAQGCVAEVVRAGSTWTAESAQEPAAWSGALDALPAAPAWVRYVLGPAAALRARGHDVPPCRVEVDSDVPIGAGLSSSAAVVCSVTAALDDALGLALGPDGLLAVSRAAENDVAGAPTGGLDQLASLRCEADAALLVDFATMSTDVVPLDLEAHALALLVVDTRVAHGHADGAYAARRRACEDAARALGVATLREVPLGAVADGRLDGLPEELRRLVRHVVTENDRVRRAAELLREGSPHEVGPLLSAGHASLRDDFRVTVPELDLAAELLEESGALGARMTGGGFGGCVVGLVPADLVDAAAGAAVEGFSSRGFGEPGWFVARPSAGAHRAPAP